jgi:hypothetical protein
MPKCINDTTKYYTGNEKSPMGLGYCSSGEEIGQKMKGKDNNLWIVKEGEGGKKRWIKFNGPEADPEPDPEPDAEPHTEPHTEPDAEPHTEPHTELDPELDTILHTEIKPEKIISTKRNALYYDVASDIFSKNKKYNHKEYISKIEIYIEEYKDTFKLGDILFVGLKDDSLSRNEWGFAIILNDGNYELSAGLSSAGSLPLLDEDVIEILSNKVSYKAFFEKYKEHRFFNSSFLNDDPEMYDELKKDYQKYNIW